MLSRTTGKTVRSFLQQTVRNASTDAPVASRKTALFSFHAEHKAKFVDFAVWKMPVIYPEGMKAEHLHCRKNASIFDVSHMGQIRLVLKYYFNTTKVTRKRWYGLYRVTRSRKH
jgi:hypothetical protein